MTKHIQTACLVLCVLTLLLGACSGVDKSPTPETDKPSGAFAEFENQELAWKACDFGDVAPGPAPGPSPFGDRLECATLKIPLDWKNSERGAVSLDVLRFKASDEAKRKGAIFVNPGGPGADGLFFGAVFGLIFSGNSGPTATPELFSQISNSYDIVGFSPRGTGSSFQLLCDSDATPPNVEPFTDRSEENVQALLTQARLSAEACKSDPISSYIDTEQTVQDMDLIRRLLGDEKLNYLGFSYGSWLGAWYAKRFPENAGNIVLSANTNFAATWQEVISLEPLGTQRGFEDVVVPYLARNDARFGLGTTDEEVYSVYESLETDLKVVTAETISSEVSNSGDVPIIGQTLVVAKGINTLLEGLESPPAPEDQGFLEQVAAYPYSEDEEINAELSELATYLAQDYLEASIPTPAPLLPAGAVYTSVTCNDSAWNQDPEFYVNLGNEQDEIYPLLGGRLTREPCAFWGEPTATMPEVPENLPSVLLVQSGYDPLTPSEGALAAFESLPGARLVYIENELSHTVFPYNTECVDAKVASFLLDGTLPKEDVTNCDALPLPGETEVFAPGTAPSMGASVTTQGVVKAATSAGENELYNLVHNTVEENAAKFFGH